MKILVRHVREQKKNKERRNVPIGAFSGTRVAFSASPQCARKNSYRSGIDHSMDLLTKVRLRFRSSK